MGHRHRSQLCGPVSCAFRRARQHLLRKNNIQLLALKWRLHHMPASHLVSARGAGLAEVTVEERQSFCLYLLLLFLLFPSPFAALYLYFWLEPSPLPSYFISFFFQRPLYSAPPPALFSLQPLTLAIAVVPLCICSRCFGSITFWILMHFPKQVFYFFPPRKVCRKVLCTVSVCQY